MVDYVVHKEVSIGLLGYINHLACTHILLDTDICAELQ